MELDCSVYKEVQIRSSTSFCITFSFLLVVSTVKYLSRSVKLDTSASPHYIASLPFNADIFAVCLRVVLKMEDGMPGNILKLLLAISPVY